VLLSLAGSVGAQSECARRPFPTTVPLRANESIIINLDEYFEGSNLTFKVTPNNSYAAIESTYQCSAATGSQRMGRVITSRYFLQGSEEVVAVRVAICSCWRIRSSVKVLSVFTYSSCNRDD
jgi:hypothetical protein